MTSLRPVVKDDLRALFAVKVAPEQENFVAPNPITLAQAAYETGSEVYGIWDGETAVGLTAMIDFRLSDDLMEGDDPNSAYLWRLMIGAEHQGKGHGKRALAFFRDWARDKGLSRVTLTVAPQNTYAVGFYESFGFKRTGRIVEREIELADDL